MKAIAHCIPELKVEGNAEADTILIGWGGTYGHLIAAQEELNKAGIPTAHAQLRYINPLPANAIDVISKYKTSSWQSSIRASWPTGCRLVCPATTCAA